MQSSTLSKLVDRIIGSGFADFIIKIGSALENEETRTSLDLFLKSIGYPLIFRHYLRRVPVALAKLVRGEQLSRKESSALANVLGFGIYLARVNYVLGDDFVTKVLEFQRFRDLERAKSRSKKTGDPHSTNPYLADLFRAAGLNINDPLFRSPRPSNEEGPKS
jgi:hypothetical protein